MQVSQDRYSFICILIGPLAPNGPQLLCHRKGQSLPLCFASLLRNHHIMPQGEQARLSGLATPVSLSNRLYKNPSQCFSNLPLPACEISLLRHSQWVKSLESSPIPGRRPLDEWITTLKPDFVCSAGRRPPCHFLFKQRRGSYPFLSMEIMEGW